MELFSDAVTFAVIFQKRSKSPHWSSFWLHRDFAHVYLLRECERGTMIINPLAWGIMTDFDARPFDQVVIDHAKDSSACLLYVADYRFNTYSITRLIYSCVQIVKSVLGFRSGATIQTPKSLYRALLLKQGAKVIKPWSPWVGEENG